MDYKVLKTANKIVKVTVEDVPNDKIIKIDRKIYDTNTGVESITTDRYSEADLRARIVNWQQDIDNCNEILKEIK